MNNKVAWWAKSMMGSGMMPNTTVNAAHKEMATQVNPGTRTTRLATSASAGASVIKARLVRSIAPGRWATPGRSADTVAGIPSVAPSTSPRAPRASGSSPPPVGMEAAGSISPGTGSATAPTGEYMVIPTRR